MPATITPKLRTRVRNPGRVPAAGVVSREPIKRFSNSREYLISMKNAARTTMDRKLRVQLIERIIL
ncbi:MAG: hypothetical protein AABX02_05440, partial [archaeon]